MLYYLLIIWAVIAVGYAIFGGVSLYKISKELSKTISEGYDFQDIIVMVLICAVGGLLWPVCIFYDIKLRRTSAALLKDSEAKAAKGSYKTPSVVGKDTLYQGGALTDQQVLDKGGPV